MLRGARCDNGRIVGMGSKHTGRRTTADRFRWLFRLSNRLEALQVRYLGVSSVSLLWRTQVLLLETTGRRTGRTRRAAVAYWHHDGAYLVGGGAGGMTKVDWVANLRATSRATVWVRRRRIPVTVTELQGDRYDEVREEALRRWPSALKYEQISGRRLPFFELTPTT